MYRPVHVGCSCLLCNTARLVVLSMPLQYFQCLAPIQCFLEHKCFAIICQHNYACSLLFSLRPPIDFPHSSVQLKCSSFGKRQSWYLFVTHIDFLATFFPSEGKHRPVYLSLSRQIFIRIKEWFDP